MSLLLLSGSGDIFLTELGKLQLTLTPSPPVLECLTISTFHSIILFVNEQFLLVLIVKTILTSINVIGHRPALWTRLGRVFRHMYIFPPFHGARETVHTIGQNTKSTIANFRYFHHITTSKQMPQDNCAVDDNVFIVDGVVST